MLDTIICRVEVVRGSWEFGRYCVDLLDIRINLVFLSQAANSHFRRAHATRKLSIGESQLLSPPQKGRWDRCDSQFARRSTLVFKSTWEGINIRYLAFHLGEIVQVSEEPSINSSFLPNGVNSIALVERVRNRENSFVGRFHQFLLQVLDKDAVLREGVKMVQK